MENDHEFAEDLGAGRQILFNGLGCSADPFFMQL